MGTLCVGQVHLSLRVWHSDFLTEQDPDEGHKVGYEADYHQTEGYPIHHQNIVWDVEDVRDVGATGGFQFIAYTHKKVHATGTKGSTCMWIGVGPPCGCAEGRSSNPPTGGD